MKSDKKGNRDKSALGAIGRASLSFICETKQAAGDEYRISRDLHALLRTEMPHNGHVPP